ncbi:MAG: hypothetical protein V3S89_10995, partial [Desulfobacterales bacterium]
MLIGTGVRMTPWGVREEHSLENRLRRSYYELLRDDLDQFMLKYALVGSYENFEKKKIKYPFVSKRELKPRARIPSAEYECQNAFLVIFAEDTIPAIHKKNIRFFDVNRTSKANLLHSDELLLSDGFDRSQKQLESAHFFDFIKTLLPIDYALLIQRDPARTARARYSLSHFHVRIDWPIADAAEDMAREHRYISKDLYEKGDKYAEDIQRKFFEYYCLPVMAGGRRTAAIVASQYLKRLSCISTVYVGSSESRALIRISERGVSKSVLMRFTKKEIAQIEEDNNLKVGTLKRHYEVVRRGRGNIYIL